MFTSLPLLCLSSFFQWKSKTQPQTAGHTRLPHRLPKALASQGMAHSLNQAQWDWWDFHAIQENTRPWKHKTVGYFSMQKLSIYFLFEQQHSTSENETISYKSNLAAKLQGGVLYASKFSLFIHSRHTYRLILLLL